MSKYLEILSHFPITEQIVNIKPIGNGHINDTIGITIRTPQGQDELKYALQRINHNVFKDVDTLQKNIFTVTDHIRGKLLRHLDRDVDRHVLTFIRTKEGQDYLFLEGTYWRLMRYVSASKSYEGVTPDLARKAGAAFGNFQAMLADLPQGAIGETIPHFHDMAFRLEELREAVRNDAAGRAKEPEVRRLIEEIEKRSEDMLIQDRLYKEGKLPLRTMHLDTKVNNILFDKYTDEVLCVIDLDTVMPGFVTSDIGDFIRTAVNTGAEDERDLSRIAVNMDIFRAYTEGYLSTAGSFLSPLEIKLLPYGGRLLTYMQTVRFLTDYINGDVYYKVSSLDHNLVRAKAQYRFLTCLEEKEEEMDDFVDTLH